MCQSALQLLHRSMGQPVIEPLQAIQLGHLVQPAIQLLHGPIQLGHLVQPAIQLLYGHLGQSALQLLHWSMGPAMI
jgi:hypothetical protein